MPVYVLAFFAVQCHNLNPAVLNKRMMQVYQLSVYFACYCIFLQARTYRFCYCTNISVIRIPFYLSIRQFYFDLHDCSLRLFKVIEHLNAKKRISPEKGRVRSARGSTLV
ncbi:hypothetical protein D3C76_1499110 [compost metagenome]